MALTREGASGCPTLVQSGWGVMLGTELRGGPRDHVRNSLIRAGGHRWLLRQVEPPQVYESDPRGLYLFALHPQVTCGPRVG